ncbi:MAG TPA: MotA/TolQ/ExbB proton channel family protein [Sandaracinaceae bacterium LLY-WYZ-13_1]|nr:MotA/TolQ/ExbB proton channel family protein [Sandaracinaceae bacterium LLY-WYZ-13_1]
MDIQERLTAFAMLGAEWVMWLLVVLSVIVLAIVLERAYYFLASRDNLAQLKADLVKRLRGGDIDAAKKRLKASPAFEARIALAGLDAADDGSASAEERMAGESSLAKLAMERNLAFVGTVGNNAPFVGLLGTVIGVIRAFHELDQSGGQVSAGLMSEIGEALVATAIGLLVALPAVAFFNLFTRMIKARLGRGNALGSEVLAHLKSTQIKGDGPYRGGGDADDADEE